jgi:predicted nucleic acid-binding protein
MTSGAGRFAFVDTSAFFGLLNTSDSWHRDALRIQRRLIEEQWRLVTTNWIVAETHALVLARLGRARASEMLRQLDNDAASHQLALVSVQAEDELKAREIIYRYDDKDFTLTDATSFAVMERLGIAYAFTFDRDFRQYGLDVLTA